MPAGGVITEDKDVDKAFNSLIKVDNTSIVWLPNSKGSSAGEPFFKPNEIFGESKITSEFEFK